MCGTLFGRLAAVAILVASLGSASFAQQQAAENVLVRVTEVGSTDTRQERVFFGRTVARQTIDLAFQVDGQIVEFPLNEGEEVPQGDMLARLDQQPFEIAAEQARLQEAQAQREADRAEQLGRNISVAQRENARTQADLAATARKSADLALERATLLAPFDAVISQRLVANYSTVAAGQPVVRLHDMSQLRIEVSVPERVVREVGLDLDIELFVRFSGQGELFPVKYVESDIETGAVAGTYKVTLGMEPLADQLVLPGYSVAVVMRRSAAAQGNRFVVPLDAVGTDPQGAHYALRFDPGEGDSGRLSRVAVEIEATDTGDIAVTSGLNRGDLIVSAGLFQLADGQSVRRFKGFEE